MKRFLWIILLSCCLSACQEQAVEVADNLMKVNVIEVQPATLTQSLQLAGTVVAKEDIAIGTPLMGLQIQSVKVEVGDVVQKGQVLATLESSQVKSQLNQNNANLQRAKANLASQQSALTEAQSNLKRYRILIQSNAISRQELEQQEAKTKAAKAAVQSANAEIAQVQAQLDDSRHQYQKSAVTAQAGEVITERHAEVGNLTDNNALFHLARDGQLEAQVEATAEELSLLQTGLDADVKILEHNIAGKIRVLALHIDDNNRTGKVRITLPDTEKISIGTPVLAQISLPEMSVPTALPITAVNFNQDGTPFVLLVNQEQKIAKRQIELGEINQGKAQILSGVNVGEKVVQKAGALINEGDKVNAVIQKW